MEEGHLSDAKGQKVNFRNAMIIMTSNVGADTIKHGPNLGFAFQRDGAVEAEAKYKEMHKIVDGTAEAQLPAGIPQPRGQYRRLPPINEGRYPLHRGHHSGRGQ